MADFRRSDYDPFLWWQGLVINSAVYDRFGNQNTFEARVLQKQENRFFVRITDSRMAHETFLSDPCDLSQTVIDPTAAAALIYGLHSEMVVTDTELQQSLEAGDKIRVRCKSGLNGDKFDLRNVEFVSIVEKAPNAANINNTTCPAPASRGNFNNGNPISSFNYDLLRTPDFPEPDVLEQILATEGNPPTKEKVIAAIQRLFNRLPKDGESYIVAIVNRNAYLDSDNPRSPWDDWVGILRNEAGEFYWRATLGTAEPDWRAMTSTRFNGADYPMGRVVVPSFNEYSHGGGFHKWEPHLPAFRQAGLIQMEMWTPVSPNGSWSAFTARGPDFGGKAANHNHTTSIRGSEIGNGSHGCIVAKSPAEHYKNLQLAGWEPEAPDGGAIRHSLVALDISDVQ